MIAAFSEVNSGMEEVNPLHVYRMQKFQRSETKRKGKLTLQAGDDLPYSECWLPVQCTGGSETGASRENNIQEPHLADIRSWFGTGWQGESTDVYDTAYLLSTRPLLH
jgi:hypothetical protein